MALDTAISPELSAEGRAREIVHRVQTVRKEAGLRVEDRIELLYDGAPELQAVIADFADYVRRETLAVSLRREESPGRFAWSGQIDDLPLQLGLKQFES